MIRQLIGDWKPAELTAVAAAAELMRGSLEEGARYVAVAEAGEASVPAGRRDHFRVFLAVLRLYLARQRGDLRAAAEEVEQLQSADSLDVAQLDHWLQVAAPFRASPASPSAAASGGTRYMPICITAALPPGPGSGSPPPTSTSHVTSSTHARDAPRALRAR